MILLFVAMISFVYIVATKLRYRALLIQYEHLRKASRNNATISLIADTRKKITNAEAYPQTKGIYMYEHKRNGKCYIGKSVNMNRRCKQHFSTSTRASVDVHFNRVSDYNFYILEEMALNTTEKQLHQAERFWINLYIYSGKKLLNSTL